MKTIRYILHLLLVGLLFSCSGFLDEKPELSMVIPNKLDDFQALLDSEPITINTYPKLGFIASDDMVFGPTLLGQIDPEERAAYFWKNELYTLDPRGVDWPAAYSAIFYANLVVDGIKDFESSSPVEEQRAKELDAAARFYRAFFHFALLQQYAEPYNESNKNNPGIPIRNTADINQASAVSTIQEVYDFILSDLEIARTVLPAKPDIATRASAWGAEALLSRVYLVKQDYEKAYLHASNALGIGDELMDYNEVDTDQFYPFPRFNPEVIHHFRINTSRVTYNRQQFVNPDLYELYDSTDLRSKVNFRISRTAGYFNFVARYTGDFYDFGGLATDEVILNRAEAAVRIGKKEEALEDLNRLREYRYVKGEYESIDGISDSELLKEVLLERRKELLFRGLRWLDLRRLNQDPAFAVTLERKFNEEAASLPPNSEGYTFDIPPSEKLLNPGIKK